MIITKETCNIKQVEFLRVTQVVGQRLDLICCEVILIPEDMIMSRSTCPLSISSFIIKMFDMKGLVCQTFLTSYAIYEFLIRNIQKTLPTNSKTIWHNKNLKSESIPGFQHDYTDRSQTRSDDRF